MDWNKYGQLISSQYRRKVILNLLTGPMNPKQIANKTGLYLSHVSKTLNELSRLGLINCLTPELKRGRIYRITTEGKEVASYIRDHYENK